MMSVALKGLLGRKTRSILTAMSIVLGVAMISGTYILSDTIQKAFDNVFTMSYRNTGAVISGREIVKGANNTPTVPTRLLAKIRALPDVSAASGGYLFDEIKLVDRNGKTISSGGAPNFGFGVDPREQRFDPVSLKAGRWASGPHEVVIDADTARKRHYAVGDVITAKADGPPKRYTIVGLGKIDGVSTGGATLAVFDVRTAQRILEKAGFDSISAAARPGVTEARLAAEIRPLLPPQVQVRTAQSQAQHDSQQVGEGVVVVTYLLLSFAGIALFVGAFVIFNTISITVAQRTRELATLRTLGASRRQVRRSVLVESGVIGATASVIGLAGGLALAKGLDAMFSAFGVDLPQAGTVIATRTVVVSLLVGTIVTVLAGLFPAIRATRVPAISAVREGAALPGSHRTAWRPIVAALLTVVGILAIAQGLYATGSVGSVLMLLAAGTLVLFIGIAMVSNYLVKPLTAIVGQPARRLGGSAGRLATANALRNPGRTAATAGALMIGLALVAFVATLGAGLKNSVVDALDQQVTADYVVSPNSDSTISFPTDAAATLAGVRGVRAATGIRSDHARVFGVSTAVAGIDPAAISAVYHFTWKQGSNSVLARLGDGALVDSSYATKHRLTVGSRLALESSTGVRRRFIVRGTYHAPQAEPLLPNIVISHASFDRTFPLPKDGYAFVKLSGAATPATMAKIRHALGAFPETTVRTRAAWVKQQAKSVDQIIDLFYVLLALSVIVSLFGMVNTLVLAVFERTRELGMLRAVGMSRRQVRRMIRHESVITALIGAALGLPLGVFLAALVTRGLADLGIGFHVPMQQLAYFGWIAVVAGIWAAIAPARRAARLDVLEALQYE